MSKHMILHPHARWLRYQSGFSLIELLLSMAILAILMLVITNVISTTQKTWVRANSRVSQFREARMAFELITRNLPQATLNTYLQADTETQSSSIGTYASGEARTRGKNYIRKSELQFISGPTAGSSGLLGSATPAQYPGHGVFFQALLGITSPAPPAPGGNAINTENMVNLLCGRGYFLNWGDDTAFRPPFLPATVKTRHRYRLMEYSPTSESNMIYYDANVTPAAAADQLPDLSQRRSITDPARSKTWYQSDVLAGVTDINTKTGDIDTANSRGFVRPVAENIIALVLSPQLEIGAKSATGASLSETSIAPSYFYDSAVAAPTGTQPVNQHQIPPLIKITLVAVDSVAGEKLSSEPILQGKLAEKLATLFTDAKNYSAENSAYHTDLAALEAFLIQNHLSYRIFTTSVIMKQARWSS